MNPQQAAWDGGGNGGQLAQDGRSGDGAPQATSAAAGAGAIGAAGPSAVAHGGAGAGSSAASPSFLGVSASMAPAAPLGPHPAGHAGGWNGCPPSGAWPGMAATGARPPAAFFSAPPGTSAAMWPQDWWAGCAAATLNSDFSFSNPQYGVFNSDVPSEDELPIPVRGSSARRGRGGGRSGNRGGRPARGKGGGRGGGRPRKPPAPVRAAVEVEETPASVADWVDENNNQIVCELFADECRVGNRSNTHLNKAGYKNVIKHFKDRTGLLYTRLQFKNKWDRLKIDYGIWKKLTKQTGLGWDESGKNIVMTKEWWKKTMKDIKGSSRFRYKGLEYEDKLAIMFEDLRNSGDDHWCASSGVVPSHGSPSCDDSQNEGEEEDDEEEEEEEEDADNEDDSEPEVTPSSTRGKRALTTAARREDKGKQPKTSGGHWFQEQMGKLMEMNERTTTSCESFARREDSSDASIQDVMKLVKECGATPGTHEHFIASIIFTKKAEREMFLTMDSPEARFNWLKMKYEWMTRNDVAK